MAATLALLTNTGLVVGVLLSLLGLLAVRYPWFDLVNQGRMLVAAGSLVVLGLAILGGNGWAIVLALAIVGANLLQLLSGLRNAAPRAPRESRRFVRVVTLNTWRSNQNIDDVAAFLAEADAELVVLQEIAAKPRRDRLRERTKARYPYALGEASQLLLSKYPILASGHLDGQETRPSARAPLLLWARFEIDGFPFVFAGLHLAFPFKPREQVADIETVLDFVRGRKIPLVIAGDYNLTPWSRGMRRFASGSGLLRYNTFRLTWPVRRWTPLIPLVGIDNVFASREFACLRVGVGPRLGSDHLPIIADLALIHPRPNQSAPSPRDATG